MASVCCVVHVSVHVAVTSWYVRNTLEPFVMFTCEEICELYAFGESLHTLSTGSTQYPPSLDRKGQASNHVEGIGCVTRSISCNVWVCFFLILVSVGLMVIYFV